MIALKWMKNDNIIDSIDKLRTKVTADYLEHRRFHIIIVGSAGFLLNNMTAEVGCHNYYCMSKVDGSALPVRQASIIQYLQQNIKYIRMRFFHLVQQNHRIGTSAHGFC